MSIKAKLKRLTPQSVKRLGIVGLKKWGLWTGSFRTLPDLIIVGAQKSGTSSLWRYLKEHPQVYPSLIKEVNYFGGRFRPNPDNYAFGERWYRSHFPLTGSVPKDGVVFEASVNYLADPRVPERMAKLLPDAKMILLLKDPVERAISHYYQSVRRESESLSIEEAFAKEPERLGPIFEASDFHAFELNHYSYLYRSYYDEQVERLLKFYPREQLLVIKSEDFFEDKLGVMRRIYEFIGVDPDYQLQETRAFHVNPNNFGAEEELKQKLRAHFKEHNEALGEYLGEAFNW